MLGFEMRLHDRMWNGSALQHGNQPSSPSFWDKLNDFFDLPLPSDHCKNGGTLVDGKCQCTLRYEGAQCERERCMNGGRRHSLEGKVKCHCPFGLSGDRCEIVTYCEPGRGKLVNGKCECFERWTGNFCHMHTCYNGIPTGGMDGFCLCDIGYTGPFCDAPIICRNGGSVNQENECSCLVGYTGERCEMCSPGFVRDGSYCVPEVSESSLLAHTGSLTSRPFAWPIVLMGCAAALAFVVLALTVVFAVRKWSSKPSRVNSVQGDPEGGTDV
ncbi:unnamed protein product [Caenorhabditis auriculariae]|uniref:EGF-like domain-containing protein n=1 Tax=Caenorhabditis auriculariae TaxID=2777116 RepID=A0A8S1HKK1_9PELO|nr:unnamed protein product [Caenorhabditis auriculariae]